MTIEVLVKKTGGPEVMEISQSKLSENPEDNSVRIKHRAIGVNYIDTYHRDGTYPIQLPSVLGMEAVGEIIKKGDGVRGFSVGDRVGYASLPLGSYCDVRDYPSDKIVKIPDYISDVQAASILLKGMTVEYLFNRTYKLKAGEHFLFHAAAGGVGLLACQWSKAIGAKMIGTVSTKEKAILAKNLGCDYVINYKEENVVEKLMDITNNKGVSVVYDGVGKDTFENSISSLQDRGLFVSFGQSSGMVNDVNLHKVFAPKNLFYTRPSLIVYNKKRGDLENSVESLFGLVKEKKIKTENIKEYKLEDVRTAHQELQNRKTVGSLVLIP